MVSALLSRSSGLVSSHVLRQDTFTLTVPFHPDVQMDANDLNAGVTLQWSTIPFRGFNNFWCRWLC